LKNNNFYIWEGVFDNFKEANKLKLGLGFSGKKWKIEQSKIFKICEDYVRNKKNYLCKILKKNIS
tara:strand:- start:1534 stop:1728 length:195 start_codon:yes stop_codon:yes gene_type:complete